MPLARFATIENADTDTAAVAIKVLDEGSEEAARREARNALQNVQRNCGLEEADQLCVNIQSD